MNSFQLAFVSILFFMSAESTTMEFYRTQCLEMCCNNSGAVNFICPYVCTDCAALRAVNSSKTQPTEKPSLTEVLTGKIATTTVPPVAAVPTEASVLTTTAAVKSAATSVESVLAPPPVPTAAANDSNINSTLQQIFLSAYKSSSNNSQYEVIKSNSSLTSNSTVNGTVNSTVSYTVNSTVVTTNATQEANSTVTLSTTVAPETTVAIPASSEEDLALKLCCSFAGVPDSCNICSWDANKTSIMNAGLVCLPYFKQFSECAAEGHNNADCCMSEGVHISCIGFCTTEIPPFDSSLLHCLDYTSQIFKCHKTTYTSWKVETATP